MTALMAKCLKCKKSFEVGKITRRFCGCSAFRPQNNPFFGNHSDCNDFLNNLSKSYQDPIHQFFRLKTSEHLTTQFKKHYIQNMTEKDYGI